MEAQEYRDLKPQMKFEFGRLVATPGAIYGFKREFLASCIRRHLTGDWGTVPKEDAQANEHALKDGDRIMSVYVDDNGEKLWIITEADRSATTLLLPSEY